MEKARILRISHLFTPSIIGKVISGISGFEGFPYEAKLAALLSRKVDNTAALSAELRSLGYGVEDLYPDVKPLQMQWASENGRSQEELGWYVRILLEQIGAAKPDILFFQKIPRLPKKVLFNLKRDFPSIKKVVYHTAYLGNTGDLSFVDLLLVGTPSLVDRYRERGIKAELFYHYFDKSIQDSVPWGAGAQDLPLTFLGSSGYGGGFLHADRYHLIRHLLENTVMEAWLSEPEPEKARGIRQKARSLAKGAIWAVPLAACRKARALLGPGILDELLREVIREREFLLDGNKIPDRRLVEIFPGTCHQPVMGLEYYQILARSKISFTKACNNVYEGRASGKGDIGALRLFEATGLGSCMVADTGPNMSDLFEEDREIVCFEGKEEALSKVRYLLDHPRDRCSIAESGRLRTEKCHLASHRAEQFACLLESAGKR